jgi:succinate-semialdehyde dehydrogenase/glutarate-semialdehyde dehydrogenase
VREDAREALAAAKEAQSTWGRTSVAERTRLCRRIADLIQQRAEALARWITLEQGKPLHAEAQAEVQNAALWFRLAAEYAMALETPLIPVENPHKRAFTLLQPRGVYAIITPWNFPLGIPSQLISAALVMGNSFVWVPAPTTPTCAVKLMECLVEAPLPPGVANLVLGPGPVVGDEIAGHEATDAVAFVGSSATGRTVATRAAGKPQLLELGGNGPTVVLADADLDLAVPRILAGCTRNAGQVCSATGRILVHRSLQEPLAERLSEAMRRIRVGDPFEPQTHMGPLHNERTVRTVEEHLADARARGARIVCGGHRLQGLPTPLYFLPAVVADVPAESRLHLEETFGPVAALIPFDDEADVLRLAHASPYGHTAAIFTRDVARALRLAECLHVGLVNINDNSFPGDPRVPRGGASGTISGLGRRGGKYTLLEMADLKTVVLDVGGTDRSW